MPVRAGPLQLVLRGPRLLDIRCGGVEVWHAVSFLYRDADWLTPEPVVDDVTSTTGDATFSIHIRGRFPARVPIDFRIGIEGTDDGCIRFAAEALPLSDVATNRMGICVLHPMSFCAASVEIEHTDGRISRSTFPTLIPPWPPFMLIRAIRHEYAPGQWARCVLDGDSFELEDQRNNADPSFKTYSRSNMMPRPYTLRAGMPVRQSAELRVERHSTARAARRERGVVVHVAEPVAALPSVGVEIVAGDLPLASTRDAVRILQPAHLHLALRPERLDVDWGALKALLALGNADLRLDIELADAADATETLERLRRSLAQATLVPGRVAVFPGDHACVDAARRAFLMSKIGTGTPHFFVQLNRAERLANVDFLTFTTSSVVHGADDDSVMLTLQSLPSMVQTLDAHYPGMRICIGPSGIGARGSPLGKQPETDGSKRVALAREDPRRRGRFGAAWTLGYVAQLATLQPVDAVTLLSLAAPGGIVERDGDDAFRVLPPFCVLQRLCSPAEVRTVRVSDPSSVVALALVRNGAPELFLANLTSEALDVGVRDLSPVRFVQTLSHDSTVDGDAGFGWTLREADIERGLRLDAYEVVVVE